ncbi:Uncharacterised protein [Mycolicibacterium smegmatis]|nr:Uncharacterised protein [Mycolicibacterium smegmatis]
MIEGSGWLGVCRRRSGRARGRAECPGQCGPGVAAEANGRRWSERVRGECSMSRRPEVLRGPGGPGSVAGGGLPRGGGRRTWMYAPSRRSWAWGGCGLGPPLPGRTLQCFEGEPSHVGVPGQGRLLGLAEVQSSAISSGWSGRDPGRTPGGLLRSQAGFFGSCRPEGADPTGGRPEGTVGGGLDPARLQQRPHTPLAAGSVGASSGPVEQRAGRSRHARGEIDETVTYLSPREWRHTCSSTPITATPSNRAGSAMSTR